MPAQYHSRGRATAPADIFIATTSGSGKPMPNYVASLEATRQAMAERGIAADYLLHTGDCHVDDARNAVVRKFMESGAPRLLFIDDDVGWDAEEFLKFIAHDRDVVAAVYPKKADEPEYPVMTLPGALQGDADGLVKVRGVPTGFLMLSRGMLERMIARSVPYVQQNGDETPSHLLFERGLINGKRWSGDYYFCHKWREIGGEIFVDPEMSLSHCGLKTWTGHLGDYWRKEHGVLDPYLDGAFQKLREGIAPQGVFDILVARSGNYPWCCEPELLAETYHRALATSGHILETGSGLSTIAMGMACLKSGGTVHSLEHNLNWFRLTRDRIKRYRLPNIRLYYAPLREQPNGSAWYEFVPELPAKFDLVVCDGPPRDEADRTLLWSIYGDKIADADWIIDDIGDPQKYEAMGRRVDVRGRFAVVTK